ncbi:MAG: TetR/AcrR family transcriptional regulator [Deltaproteobacteria bacterium]|jgi:AcrR family transcriptional regulator|nr:TetR/AcrR family transcriptional regulator [Deltaproteobacteria bacterium]MBW2496382.1 TetR/AcrR family transcriptional regulator [Deltaproteobacteria bacterium]
MAGDTSPLPLRAEIPVEPRRRPRQDRSKATVDAIIEACVRILDQQGPDALTTNRIAEVAGVAKGSLYQYFPNKEAIVSAVFERILRDDFRSHEEMFPEWSGLSLEESVVFLIDRMLERDRRLAKLHGAFYRAYHRNFDLGREWERSNANADLIVSAVRQRLEAHADRIRTANLELAAFFLTRGLRGLMWKVIEERPEALETDALRAELLALFLGYLVEPDAE